MPLDPSAASTVAYTTSGSTGETARPIFPSDPLGIPLVIFFHVLPPSVERWIALSGPPLISVQKCRRRCQVAAMMMSGFRGSSTTSVTPVCALTVMMLSHVLPPSIVLYKPRSPPSAQSGPCAATYTTFEFLGSTTIWPMCSEFASPMFLNVRPPSSER